MLLPQSYWYPNLLEGADNVGGQLRKNKDRVPLQWRNQFRQSLEEGAGKRFYARSVIEGCQWTEILSSAP